MYSGEKLGIAIREAINLKGVKQADVAKFFNVKQQAISAWLKNGRVSKEHIDKLIEYFSDVVEPSHFGIKNMGLINAPNHGTIGTQTNVSGNQTTYTNNFLSDSTPEEARAILSDKDAQFLTAMPLLGIDDGVAYALNPKETLLKIKDIAERAATFIPHSDMTFGVKIADNSLKDISQQHIQINDILIIEPRIPPRHQDLVLVCLNPHQPTQRGLFARLFVDLQNNYTIQHSSAAPERLPENALICGVVVEIKRRLLPNDLVASRINTDWNILNTQVNPS